MNDSFAYVIAADGTAARLADPVAPCPAGGQALVWRHFDGTDEAAANWLAAQGDVPETVVGAMHAMETRPRASRFGDGVLVNLRGVNQNPDADPDDLVSIRLWVTAHEIVSINFRPLLATSDMRDVLNTGAIRDAGDFLVELADVLTQRLDRVLDDLSGSLGRLETDVIEGVGKHLRSRIGKVRRTAIELRRYIAPQREALSQLATGNYPFFDESDRQNLAEAAHSVSRIVEEIDSLGAQAAVLADQLSDIRSEAVAKRTLVLSIVSSIFLPLTFVTGLLGMNVAGIPFAHEPWAFAAIMLVNGLLAVAVLLYLRRRGWFG
jgi:zinc transporter